MAFKSIGDYIKAIADGIAAGISATIGSALPAGTNMLGGIKDAGPNWTPVRALVSSADLQALTDLSAVPTAGQKVVIDDLWVSVDTAMRVDIKEETTATVLWSAYLPANGAVQYTPRDGLKLDTADKKVRALASVAGNIRIILLSHSEA